VRLNEMNSPTAARVETPLEETAQPADVRCSEGSGDVDALSLWQGGKLTGNNGGDKGCKAQPNGVANVWTRPPVRDHTRNWKNLSTKPKVMLDLAEEAASALLLAAPVQIVDLGLVRR
jgi:hypothetical protein